MTTRKQNSDTWARRQAGIPRRETPLNVISEYESRRCYIGCQSCHRFGQLNRTDRGALCDYCFGNTSGYFGSIPMGGRRTSRSQEGAA
jgi:hypothetical protein